MAIDLDAVFSALADPTRRAILARLTQGDAPVAALAAPFLAITAFARSQPFWIFLGSMQNSPLTTLRSAVPRSIRY